MSLRYTSFHPEPPATAIPEGEPMADFHEYRSFWEATKPHERGLSPHDFYRGLCSEHRQEKHAAQYRHALAEQRWTDDGCPYFRMHEDTIHLLRGVSIDIPFRYVRAPFDVFAMNFPRQNSLVIADGRYVRSMLVSLLADHFGGPCFTLLIDWGEVAPVPPHVPLVHGIRRSNMNLNSRCQSGWQDRRSVNREQ